MPPRPIDSLGSIFSPNPQYLSNCSVRASVLPSPAGVQLHWAPRPGEGAFASVRNAEKQKSSPALSQPRPAICRAISELSHLTHRHLTETGQHPASARAKWQWVRQLGWFPRDFASRIVRETIESSLFSVAKMSTAPCIPRRSPIQVLTWLNVA